MTVEHGSAFFNLMWAVVLIALAGPVANRLPTKMSGPVRTTSTAWRILPVGWNRRRTTQPPSSPTRRPPMVTRSGGHRTFTVTAEGQYGKDDLPPEVFNFDKPTPELRLITCGGVFDRSTGHYRDNFVIYAELDV